MNGDYLITGIIFQCTYILNIFSADDNYKKSSYHYETNLLQNVFIYIGDIFW